MNIGRAAVVVAGAVLTLSGCGYRLGAYSSDDGVAARPTQERAVAAAAATPAMPTIRHNASVSAANLGVPPNADGDPACPPSLAWGRQPEGHGVLVTILADETTAVTVLVRTSTGVDVAKRAVLNRADLRLLEFPTVDPTAVREVLIMTNAQRCFAVADPLTFR